MPHPLAAFMLLVCLSSCALLPTPAETNQAEFIPMAQPIGPARRIVQQITAIWPNHQETMVCVLELDKHHIAVAGLSGDGISLFNLSYDGKKLAMEKSPLLPSNFSPELIIKDLQLVYWPVAELQKILPKQWRIDADNSHRRLYLNNNSHSDVDYLAPDPVWPKSAKLTNYRYRYQLTIKTLSYDTLSE